VILRVFISIIILIFSSQSLTKADDISELLIEEMSVGDSLLQYMSIDEIKEEFSITKNHYVYLRKPLKYREVYLYKNFENYDVVSFFVNPNDANLTILAIRGLNPFINKMDKCLKKRSDIAKEIEKIISKYSKDESNFKSSLDTSGRSIRNNLTYILPSGDEILLSCNDWEETLRKKNNWSEGISVMIWRKEIVDWFSDR
jgi:hypothetical protein